MTKHIEVVEQVVDLQEQMDQNKKAKRKEKLIAGAKYTGAFVAGSLATVVALKYGKTVDVTKVIEVVTEEIGD